jgi:hypothetical protein
VCQVISKIEKNRIPKESSTQQKHSLNNNKKYGLHKDIPYKRAFVCNISSQIIILKRQVYFSQQM